MNPKDVIFWPGFSFEDGGRSDKLLVVLGARGAEARLLLKTTSQPSAYRPDADGCHAVESVFRFKTNRAGFHVPTWVQFEMGAVENVTDMRGAGARVMFTLKETDFNAIVNCYKKSPDISPELAKFVP